jgi:hypothetical protein
VECKEGEQKGFLIFDWKREASEWEGRQDRERGKGEIEKWELKIEN